ncbi:DNA polymerase III subunit alpha [Pontibacillus salipaludis]|uniref:DNA polymerase III subunit alpha n=1 Tax=Pontibacillus salipaludis TaxID=1697394 RepID=A0ABQ1Q7G9_9BACI|nr:DNA polymerase III subunit alpha [Pontibacillus salipaludis]GGD16874.1 DNA polymerase III subunit alpha [Pontibacillus salipaludis]
MDFVHLQVRSGYSLMRSTNTIEKLVATAKEQGFTSLALTDEGVMYGAVSFYQTCIRYGIKPIIGLTVPVFYEGGTEKLVLLAKSNRGYEKLVALSSYLQMSEQGGLDRSEINAYTGDCIGILPLYESSLHPFILQNEGHRLSESLHNWKKDFKDGDFYIGVEDHGLEEERHLHVALEEVMPEGVPMVALQDVWYLNEEDVYAYDCLQSIRSNTKWDGEPSSDQKHHHFRSSKEMHNLFGEWKPELLTQTKNIADRCNISLSFDRMMLPSYPVPTEETSDQYLRSLCEQGLGHRYGDPSKEVRKRLDYELSVIESMQFSDYFLIVWDFMAYARKEKIMTGPGRGSAAGSLVAYLLYITDVDPIKYDLLFERFLNPDRVTMPDIDIDFSDVRRDEVIQYVAEKYGAEHVAQIITFGTFGPRSVIRELIKTMGIDQQEAAYLMKFIPQQSSGSVVEIVQDSKELKEYIQGSDKLKRLFRIATRLEGLPRHASTHAAGVVISQKPLMKNVPLTSGHDGVPLTQFAMNELEAIGLLKMDFLGLRNLSLIERMTESIKKKESISVTFDSYSDPATFSLLRNGKTTGVFQLESKGMRDVLERLQPSHFEDIVAVNALYRPGPMEFIQTYINRKHGKEEVTYPHPDLQPILHKTYGVLVYQEQIMQIAHKMAGFSLGQADILRRAVSKKKEQAILEQKNAFIKGCTSNGYTTDVAEEMFQWIISFSNYGFNRSHAVAYSVISYQLAFLKAHYPAYFMAELMSSVSSDRIQSYVNEARELSVPILSPSVNRSFGKYTVEYGSIRIGLGSIKGVGRNVLKEIIQARKEKPFKHLFDFCRRVSLTVVNRPVIESLILAGCFDDTNSNRASLLASVDHAMEQGELFSETNEQESFFMEEIELGPSYIEVEPFSKMKQLGMEREVLGMYISSHPLASYREQLRENGFLSLREASKAARKKQLKASVVIQELKVIRTKRGDPMAFLTLGDEQTEMEAVVFPDLFREVRQWLDEELIVFIVGRMEERNGKLQWILEQIGPFKEEELVESSADSRRLFVKIQDEKDSTLKKVKEIATQYPGKVPIIVHYPVRKETYQLGVSYAIEPKREAIKLLEEELGRANVVLK